MILFTIKIEESAFTIENIKEACQRLNIELPLLKEEDGFIKLYLNSRKHLSDLVFIEEVLPLGDNHELPEHKKVDHIQSFSDGSALGNPGPGGWGVVLKAINTKHVKELSGSQANSTNNQMELKGAIEGLKAIKSQDALIEIISDSNYVVKGINEWLPGWIKNNWKNSQKKPVKNKELWQEYIEVAKGKSIIAKWVKGHAGHTENERCDYLARTAAESIRD